METHGPDGDTVTIWTYAGLSIVRTFCGALHLRVIIHGSGSQLSLHVAKELTLSGEWRKEYPPLVSSPIP